MKKLMVATVITGISLTVLYVNAQDIPEQAAHKSGAKKFEAIDSNADGFLTLEETLAFHEEKFKVVDADGDGMITQEEARNGKKRMRFDRVDTNDDGFISEEEALAVKGRFAKARR